MDKQVDAHRWTDKDEWKNKWADGWMDGWTR